MAQSHISGPLSVERGNPIIIPMGRAPGTHAAASGTTIPAWRAVLPDYDLRLRSIALTFAGGASAPQGGMFRVKVWAGAVAKGVLSASVAGGSAPAIHLQPAGVVTMPAGTIARLTIHTVGGTAAGGGGQPSLYCSH